MPQKVPVHRPAHLPAARPVYERLAARKEDKAFYKRPEWRIFRAWYLSQHPLCVDCRAEGRLTPAAHVHHRIERKIAPTLAFDPENMAALCAACHGRRRSGPA